MCHIKPVVVAIWCGRGKPDNVNDYLNQFVMELIELQKNGLEINGYKIRFVIRLFICDAPARAFIKGTHSISIHSKHSFSSML